MDADEFKGLVVGDVLKEEITGERFVVVSVKDGAAYICETKKLTIRSPITFKFFHRVGKIA